MTSKTILRVLFCSCVCTCVALGELRNCIRPPNYVTPNVILMCTCWAREAEGAGAQALLEWESPKGQLLERGSRGQSSLGLPLSDVPWAESGRPLSCFLIFCTNATRVFLGSYTPYIAYGPENVTIASSNLYIPEDGSTMTLTCIANVNPRPRFRWEGHPPGAVVNPGCRCSNGTFSETLTFDPRGSKDGDVIRCQVTNTVERWSKSAVKTFQLRSRPGKPVTVSLEQHLALTIILGAMLLMSLVALFVQRWRNRNRNQMANLANAAPPRPRQAPGPLQAPQAPGPLQAPQAPGSLQAPQAPGSLQAPQAPGSLQAPQAPGSLQAPQAPGSLQAPQAPGSLQALQAPASLQNPSPQTHGGQTSRRNSLQPPSPQTGYGAAGTTSQRASLHNSTIQSEGSSMVASGSFQPLISESDGGDGARRPTLPSNTESLRTLPEQMRGVASFLDAEGMERDERDGERQPLLQLSGSSSGRSGHSGEHGDFLSIENFSFLSVDN